MNWVLIVSTQNVGISSNTFGFIIKEKKPNNTLSTYLESSFPRILEITCKTNLISTAKMSKENRFPSREN